MELGKVRLDIEKSLVPQGPGVTRHLSLPQQGQTPEWILEEMAKMDAETHKESSWKEGKMSGAVYRAHYSVLCIFWGSHRIFLSFQTAVMT